MPKVPFISQDTSRELDRRAKDEYRIPTLLLMEHAGTALASAALSLSEAPVIVCAGRGNNAGDGFVAARHIANAGRDVSVLTLGDPETFQVGSDSAVNLEILRCIGVPLLFVTDPAQLPAALPVDSPWIVVDALLGTGLRGDVRPLFAALIDRLNASGWPIVAADLPSGLDGDTGSIHGTCIRATRTVAFGFPKIGMARGRGPELCGDVSVADISLPLALRNEILLDSGDHSPNE
ncbi:MAG: NAD(P)H-hydrate epimerase [Planctomycetota bacterium]